MRPHDRRCRVKVDTRGDILLLLLYAPNGVGVFRGVTRLMRLVDRFQCEELNEQNFPTIQVKDLYEFEGGKYGPLSPGVYEDLEFFECAEYLYYRRPDGHNPMEVELQERGQDFAHELFWDVLSADERERLRDFKKKESE